MTITELMPFESAMRSLAARNVLPTSLDSAALRQLGGAFHRQNFTSAQTLLTDLLDQYKADVGSLINPVTTQRADRVTTGNPQGNVTTGLDPATARMRARELLRQRGYAPEEADAGGIKDLSSDARINLVLRTNSELAQGAGNFLRSNDPALLDLWPAQELYRLEDRARERDWETRWRIAAAVAGDVAAARCLEFEGRMVALKSSGIWQELGDGAGGFDDTLGNPYPPFAFNSGMWVREIARDEAEELKLITADQEAQPAALDLSQLFREVAA